MTDSDYEIYLKMAGMISFMSIYHNKKKNTITLKNVYEHLRELLALLD